MPISLHGLVEYPGIYITVLSSKEEYEGSLSLSERIGSFCGVLLTTCDEDSAEENEWYEGEGVIPEWSLPCCIFICVLAVCGWLFIKA